MLRLHLLTGEYPPDSGGVGDYTHLLAHALAVRGHDVHVWCPTVADAPDAPVRLHRLPDTFGPRSARALAQAFAAAPGCVLLQYVPNALGRRGANVSFCAWLVRARRRGADIRVMFHEPFFYFSPSPLHTGLALVQRVMAWLLMRAAARVYVSTETWTRLLRPYASDATSFVPLAIPSTVPIDAAPNDVSHWRASFTAAPGTAHVVGHFGTFGDHLSRELRTMIPAVLRANPFTTFACIGRNSRRFAATLASANGSVGPRVVATGPIAPAQIPAALRACDLVVEPYPDGVTTRRTSVMAPLACGVATVTTDGRLTEGVWRETGAVRLVPASDGEAAARAVSMLVMDAQAREGLARRGRELYRDEFALERTIGRLLPQEAPHA